MWTWILSIADTARQPPSWSADSPWRVHGRIFYPHSREQLALHRNPSCTVGDMNEVTQLSGLLLQSSGRKPRQGVERTSDKLMRVFAQTFERCKHAQSRSSKSLVFASTTALKLACVDVPRELDEEELVVAVPNPAVRSNIRGVRFVVWRYPMRMVVADGIRFVAPDVAWLMLARKTAITDLVKLGDAMTRRDAEQRWFSSSQLASSLGEFEDESRRMGFGNLPAGFDRCRRASTLVRNNTDSFRETELRLLLESYGLPQPHVNYRLDLPQRSARYFLDLAYPNAKVAVEYDGAQHAGRWESDQTRLKAIEDAHWMHVSVTNEDFRDEASRRRLVHSVADRLSRCGCRVTLSVRQTERQLTDGRRIRWWRSADGNHARP